MSTYDSMDWTPAQCLDAARQHVEQEAPDRVFVLMLWDEKDQFDTKFYNCGMKSSEVVALLEVQKQRMIAMMSSSNQSGH